MKYKKRPVIIEAIQLQSTDKSIREILLFMSVGVNTNSNSASDAFESYCDNCRINEGMRIETLEGGHFASFGDYIIKGVQGEFYPCKPDIFKQTYEEVSY